MCNATRLIVILLSVLVLSACSGAVKRPDGPQISEVRPGVKYAGVSIAFTEKGKDLHRENLKFNPDELSQNVLRAMQSHDLIDPASDRRLEIVITDVRVRSNFSAVMWGFMAGNDRITGDVNIKDGTDKTVGSFQVSAAYALGGLAGGQDETRMGWLYEKFTELTLQEIGGKSVD